MRLTVKQNEEKSIKLYRGIGINYDHYAMLILLPAAFVCRDRRTYPCRAFEILLGWLSFKYSH